MTLTPNTARAQASAQHLLAYYGISRADQIRLEDIACGRRVFLQHGEIDGPEAWLFRRGDVGLVRLKAATKEAGRRRFSLAHELGHWELHMDLTQAWLCTTEDIHQYRGSPAEIEANAFAAELLMPTALFRPRCQACGIGVSLVCDLASEYSTTLTATAVRAVEEASEDCYIVFSKDGHVQWWRRNEARSSYFLARGQAIHPDSVAWNVSAQPSESRGMQQVSAQAWFPRAGEDVEVWEESVVLGDYGIALTLLSVV
jgi:hypothetical protein